MRVVPEEVVMAWFNVHACMYACMYACVYKHTCIHTLTCGTVGLHGLAQCVCMYGCMSARVDKRHIYAHTPVVRGLAGEEWRVSLGEDLV